MGFETINRPVRSKKFFKPIAGTVAEPLETLTSTGGTVRNYGVSLLTRKSSVGASTVLYTMAPPAASQIGMKKSIIMVSGGTTRTARVTLTAGSFYNSSGSTTFTKLTFNAGNDAVVLQAITTAKWAVISNIGSVTITA